MVDTGTAAALAGWGFGVSATVAAVYAGIQASMNSRANEKLETAIEKLKTDREAAIEKAFAREQAALTATAESLKEALTAKAEAMQKVADSSWTQSNIAYGFQAALSVGAIAVGVMSVIGKGGAR